VSCFWWGKTLGWHELGTSNIQHRSAEHIELDARGNPSSRALKIKNAMFPVGKHRVVLKKENESVELVAEISLAARRLGIDRCGAVGAAGRTPHPARSAAVDRAGAAAIEIHREGFQHDGVAGIFIVLQRPLLDGSINQTKIVDARIFARGFAGFDKVGNGDAGQQADNSHHNHDFDERERCLSRETNFHTNICLVPYVNPALS
jgi:hypothetical protein